MTNAAVFFIAVGLTQIVVDLVAFMVSGTWVQLLPIGGVSTLLGVAFMIAAHRRRTNRKKEGNAMHPLSHHGYSWNSFPSDRLRTGVFTSSTISSSGGHRNGAQAHRVGAAGSAGGGSGGAGDGARGAGARVMTEFAGVDYLATPEVEEAGFAAGSVKGARSFKIDKLGRLTGVHHAQVWKPGENEAACKRRQDDEYDIRFGSFDLFSGLYLNSRAGLRASDPTYRPRLREEDPHSLSECKHGFYAYYDGSDDYHETGYVSGVVEGYGETVIGTRGFRCMKARIVALHIPDDVPAHLARLVRRNYPDIPTFESFERMVSEFPPDNAGQYEAPSPDNDPDFWTRSV